MAVAQPGYPAYGVLKAGDVISAVDGHPVTGPSGLTSLIAAHPAGSTLTVTITRAGYSTENRTIDVASGSKSFLVVQLAQVTAILAASSEPAGK